MARLLAWGAVAALLLLAWNLKHPLFFWARPWETSALLFVGLCGGAAGLAAPGRHRRLLGAALLAVALCALGREIEFAAARSELHAARPALRSVGGHFVVGFRRFAEVEVLAEQGLIGGIYLTRRNLRETTPARLSAEIASLQERRRLAGLLPLVVAADQEGGEVSHLSPWLTPMPALATLLTSDDPRPLSERARAYGRAQGSELAALGVNLNFAPVVDLKPASSGFADSGKTRISVRAIAADPQLVASVAAAYAAGLTDVGVGATFKHFPGLGRVSADTHFRPARLDLDPAALAADWLPFRAAGAQTVVMVGHVTLPAVDAAHAASHSHPVITGLLRGELGHLGLVITDDLAMGAVYGRGVGRVAAEALAAGADYVLISYDPDQFVRAIQGAAKALERGEIPPDTLAASRERIASFFAAHGAARGAGAVAAAGIW